MEESQANDSSDTWQQKNDQTLQHIHQLQMLEQEWYDKLQSPALTPEKKEKMIQKINELSSMRLSMYNSLQNLYQTYQNTVNSSSDVLQEQQIAVRTIETELNQTKRKINALSQERANQIRLIEINSYYGQRYEAHKELAKIVALFLCLPLFVITILYRTGLMPTSIWFGLATLILFVGGYFSLRKWYDIYKRSNMVWDNYNWYFNRNDAEKQYPQDSTGNASASASDPWQTSTTSCIGAECCDPTNSTYDPAQNKCIANA